MKIYKIESGILINHNESFYILEDEEWDSFINDDNLFRKTEELIGSENPIKNAEDLIENELMPPIFSQEIWASGVTYYNSKLGRQEESKEAGGGDFYARVYVADRPELFFKSNRHRCVGSGDEVRIRKDSSWDVPEPELTLVITSNQKIVGYTIGNDMSSRSIEGENPLYLPQAKSYDSSASIGPCIYVTNDPLPSDTQIELSIHRHGEEVFADMIGIDQIKREFEELVGYLYRECTFPFGSFLMTGTGIVPGKDFTLQPGDEIHITIEPIGTLVNKVAK
ncbi:fumarylacetoacetate hydrolase family protein [Rhodohalobacter sulfatireducens]|uniref:Fumarylacetoacetate hydrolase family protein n=1 Tax=Rhodohalobacter sulfatireducens TaxID=2911366 RepID=A0ABS9KGY2_9BACT|nr:fumarylacetoacetate hydrolase family protein [Rhodohalobacter sulfatireducens]MCG2590091.1 fumarylacetoacetate hydrolase family protein [Rhodohalobacter sulfatireducens]